jgi:SAM-dependent methyltransferase
MIRYLGVAAALKFFSFSPLTKWAYRQLGNTLGQSIRMRRGLTKSYLLNAKETLELIENHHAIETGDKLLEIGTGWAHWEATVIRLFYDVEITLFDTCDNRQLHAYKRYFKLFAEIIDKELALDATRSDRVHRLLQVITKADSFDEIYTAFGFRYVLDSNGTLQDFPGEAFSAIFSYNVFEHINKAILPEFIRDLHRLLKPGGYSIQSINIGDHLAYYDASVSLKNYLRYSDNLWRRFFENDVQYINRVQRPEWLQLFHDAGLELVQEISVSTDIDSIKVHQTYEHLAKSDLECFNLVLVHRKPENREATEIRSQQDRKPLENSRTEPLPRSHGFYGVAYPS